MSTTGTLPLISCLTVTLPVMERHAFLQKSIAAYQRQSYPARELLLLLHGGEPADRQRVETFVAQLADPSIRIVELPGTLSLGAMRNRSLQYASGTIVCQWDDDDYYHPERLARQFQALSEADCDAVLLREVMQFYTDSRLLYCTNWHATEARAFPASLMCRRSAKIAYPEDGAEAKLGEDSAVARQLLAADRLLVVGDVPHLYVYVAHGRNSWPIDHHRMLSRELALSRGLLKRREPALREGLRAVEFGPGEVIVQGSNGMAFSLSGSG